MKRTFAESTEISGSRKFSGSKETGGKIGRRRFLGVVWGGGLMLLGAGAATLGGGRPLLLRASRRVMGTRATILLSAPSSGVGEAIAAAAFAALQDVDERMSRFRADSEVGRLNARPEAWCPVSPSTAEVLDSALAFARASDGTFDPCLERLVSLWGFHDRRYPRGLPAAGETEARSGPRYRRLEQGTTRGGVRRFRLADGGVGVDLGGIAKGYGIDRAVRVLREAGVRSALVNVGDDLFAIGGHPEGGPWRIGVRHPRRPGALLDVLEVRERAVATSGDYENFFDLGGRRFPHLLDPHSGRPAAHHQSFTVTAPTAMEADALATAAFAASPEAARTMLRRLAPGPWLAVEGSGRTYRG